MPAIDIIDPAGNNYRYELPEDGSVLLIGSAEDCSISLPHITDLLPQHCTIALQDEGYVISVATPGATLLAEGQPSEAVVLVPRVVYNIGTSVLTPKADLVGELKAVKEEVAAPAAVAAEGKAILFSRVTCPNCRVAENLLAKAGVAYEKLIADENLDLCKAYGIKGAPTLVITDGENHENHYSVPEIKKYLASL